MKSLTQAQKAYLLKLEADKFKNHAQGLKALASLENGADHQLAEILLSQIEESAATLRAVIVGTGGAQS